jgi:amino acid adenylation domain-containing protein
MNVLLQDLVRIQADRRPEAVAMADRGRLVSYGELEAWSDRLAGVLYEAGCRPGDRVGVMMPKSWRAIGAMLATLKCGAMYVPLDPSSPGARLSKIVGASDPRVLLAAGPERPLSELVSAVPSAAARVGWLGDQPPAEWLAPVFRVGDVEAAGAAAPGVRVNPDEGAHILFTSGSTGTPKGVVVPHASVLHFVRWAVQYFGIGLDDRISGQPPLHFDLSTFDIFGTFAAGAALYPVPAELGPFPHKLAEFVREARLTQWFSVPSVLNLMVKANAIREGDFPAVRRILWCGEVMPTPILRVLMTRVPHARYTNLYGPTETTIASSYYTVPACPASDEVAIPIGHPCQGEELLVLDQRGQPAAPGEVGDLYIRGVGLTLGYWRDAERTRAAFVPDGAGGVRYKTGDLARRDADGLVYFLGRNDSQIKSRGYRIELGEVEAALHSLELFRECAVVAVETEGFDGVAIACAFAPLRDGTTALEARTALTRLLPTYMLPVRWLVLDTLPKNDNGKIDRAALKRLFQSEVRRPPADVRA